MKNLFGIFTILCAFFSFTSLASVWNDVFTSESVEPFLIVNFEKNNSDFNNKYVLEEKINNLPQIGELVFVGIADNESQYSLALRRFNSIYSHLKQNVHFLVKSAERRGDGDMLSLYFVNKWNESVKKKILGSDYVSVQELNGLFKSDKKRYFVSKINSKSIETKGSNSLEQLSHLLKEIGWSLESGELDVLETNYNVPSLSVVTLDDIASVTEVKQLMDVLISQVFPLYRYEVNHIENKIQLFKNK